MSCHKIEINKDNIAQRKNGLPDVILRKIQNKALRGTTRNSFATYPEQWGKGEWEAKTLDDAKQMAIDFANGVS